MTVTRTASSLVSLGGSPLVRRYNGLPCSRICVVGGGGRHSLSGRPLPWYCDYWSFSTRQQWLSSSSLSSSSRKKRERDHKRPRLPMGIFVHSNQQQQQQHPLEEVPSLLSTVSFRVDMLKVIRPLKDFALICNANVQTFQVFCPASPEAEGSNQNKENSASKEQLNHIDKEQEMEDLGDTEWFQRKHSILMKMIRPSSSSSPSSSFVIQDFKAAALEWMQNLIMKTKKKNDSEKRDTAVTAAVTATTTRDNIPPRGCLVVQHALPNSLITCLLRQAQAENILTVSVVGTQQPPGDGSTDNEFTDLLLVPDVDDADLLSARAVTAKGRALLFQYSQLSRVSLGSNQLLQQQPLPPPLPLMSADDEHDDDNDESEVPATTNNNNNNKKMEKFSVSVLQKRINAMRTGIILSRLRVEFGISHQLAVAGRRGLEKTLLANEVLRRVLKSADADDDEEELLYHTCQRLELIKKRNKPWKMALLLHYACYGQEPPRRHHPLPKLPKNMTREELEQHCRERGISLGGTKNEMAERLAKVVEENSAVANDEEICAVLRQRGYAATAAVGGGGGSRSTDNNSQNENGAMTAAARQEIKARLVRVILGRAQIEKGDIPITIDNNDKTRRNYLSEVLARKKEQRSDNSHS